MIESIECKICSQQFEVDYDLLAKRVLRHTAYHRRQGIRNVGYWFNNTKSPLKEWPSEIKDLIDEDVNG